MTLQLQSPWIKPLALFGMIVLIVAIRVEGNTPHIAPASAITDAKQVAGLQGELQAQPSAPAKENPAVHARADTVPHLGTVEARHKAVATMARLHLYRTEGSYDAPTTSALGETLEATLAYVEQRTGIGMAHPVNVVFDRHAAACGLDAVAYTDVRTLILYTCPNTPTRRAVNILAHEYVHQLAHDRFGAPHLAADLILSEGFATWGAGRYWLGSERSFHDFVAHNYGANLLPLTTDPRGGVSIATMNQIYYQWASFVEWLRAVHGAEAFDTLYGAGRGRAPGSAPYAETLGASFGDIEAQWRTWIGQPSDIVTP